MDLVNVSSQHVFGDLITSQSYLFKKIKNVTYVRNYDEYINYNLNHYNHHHNCCGCC